MVWPDLYPSKVVIKDQVAVFVGTKAYEPPDPEERRATNPRLLAVRAPELPLDITDEVLWRCAKQSGNLQLFASPVSGDMADLLKDPDVMKKAYIGHIEETNSMLQFFFQIRDTGPSGTIHLDWKLIPDIMHEVKEKGVVRKDRLWHKTYIEKEFGVDVQ